MSLLTNLVSYWSLNESSGSALDAQGTSTLADNGGVGTAAGVVGTARTFAAAGHQYLSHADSADLSTGDVDFTFAGWFKLATIGSFPVVFRKGASGAGAREYVLYYDTGASRLTWEVDAASGGSFAILKADTFGALSAGVWYFFTCWHDSVNNLTGIAINAGTSDTASYSAGVYDGTGDFQLGASTDQSLYWDGSIDEVGLWKRVLTSTERSDLYNGGAGLAYSSFGGGVTPVAGALAAAAQSATVSLAGTVTPPAITATLGASAQPATASFAATNTPPAVTATLGAAARPPAVALAATVTPPAVTVALAAAAAPSAVSLAGGTPGMAWCLPALTGQPGMILGSGIY